MKKSLFPFTKGRFNLRLKLPLITFSLLLISFVTTTVLSGWLSQTAIRGTLEKSLATEASLQAEGIRSYLVWTRSMAIDISTVAEALDLDEEASKKVIEKMLADNEQVVGSAIAYEPYAFKPEMKFWAPYYSRANDGSLVFTQLGTPENNYPSQDWYRLAKEADKAILSPVYFDAGGAKIWMVTWSAPFHDASGRLKGVATTDIAFSQTQDIVQQISVGEQGYPILVDPNGVILGIGEQGGQRKIMEDNILITDSLEEADAWNEMANEMLQGKSGFVNLTDPQGKDVYVAYEPIGMDTGWSLGLVYPSEEVLQPTRRLQNVLVFSSVLILLIAGVALFFLSRSITNPLNRMTSWTKSFSQSGTGQPVEHLHINTNDEIEDLADAFNQMSDELGSTLGALEQRVESRTKDLATVARVSTQTSAIRDPEKMLETAVHLTQRGFNLYHAHVFSYHKDNQELQIVACGYKEGDEHEGTHGTTVIPIAQEQSLVARAARTRKPVIINDVRSDPGWLPNPLLPDTRAELAVPMIVGDELLGVLDVQADHVDAFTESDANIQLTLASQIATSYQSALDFEQSKSQADLESLVNTIGQKIQRSTSMEDTLQIAIRELGSALGAARVSAHIQAGHDHIAGEN